MASSSPQLTSSCPHFTCPDPGIWRQAHKGAYAGLRAARKRGSFARFFLPFSTAVALTAVMQLRDYWIAELGKEKAKENDSSLRIEVFAWLRKAALDVIGETGMYAFVLLSHFPPTIMGEHTGLRSRAM